ncbi:hypothetical protein PBI_OMNICRON_37 [Mycobacterium phage Omnicron]|uniref:Uncharacterized protein n=1 Tax=Mycobacterium phage Omnicron TaxID=1541819 RepID=A0A088FQ47_9CAUD|nr:hypothetical protein PBI_OMNICRON_37 [Mycobacterium phage Omnicron]AIM50370.1 hypothetical protein PBI_OMNICRON_37 [Mycobacterium phage Omnicron]
MAAPPGFWLGMFAIPAVALAVAGVAAAVMLVLVPFVWCSERFELNHWKLWPKRVAAHDKTVLPSIVACAKWTRYLWAPGWHIVICRTALARRDDFEHRERHRRVQWAIQRELDAIDRGREDGDG